MEAKNARLLFCLEASMENKKTLPLIIKMSIPPALSMLIQCLYNLVDSIYITRYDSLAMEAISLVYPIQNIILAIGLGIGIGINAYVAMKMGEGRQNKAENGATLGVLLSIIHYVIVVAVGLLVSNIFIRSFTDKEAVVSYATTYINIIIIFSFTTIVQIALEKILQADGKMMLPMISLITGSIINIVLDPILIFTFDMGILGAAIATVVGQVAATIIMIYFILSKRNRIRLSLKGLKMDKACLKAIYMVGIPSIILTAIPSIMVSLMNYILVGLNDNAVTTFGIYYKLQYFVYMAVSGISQGTMPMISYFYGANNKGKLKETVNDSIILSGIIGLVSMVIFLAIPDLIMSMFYDDLANMGYYSSLLRIASLSFIFGSINYFLASYFQAVQCGFRSLMVAVLRQFILILPIAFILSQYKGEEGVYIAIPTSEILTLIITSFIFIFEYKNRLKAMDDKIFTQS